MANFNINAYRRKGTKIITQFFLKTKPLKVSEKPIINKILISRPNHRLGNQLLITPLIQEIKHQFPDAKIYLFTRLFNLQVVILCSVCFIISLYVD